MIIFNILSGVFGVLAVTGILNVLKKYDTELTKVRINKMSLIEKINIFICCAVTFHGYTPGTLIALISAVSVCIQAYIDRHESKVYTYVSFFTFLAGAIATLFIADNIKLLCFVFFIYAVTAGICSVCGAFTYGDFEILLSLFPSLFLLNDNGTTFTLMRYMLFILLNLLLAVITSIKIKPFKILKEKPMAPTIAFSFFLVHLLYKINNI